MPDYNRSEQLPLRSRTEPPLQRAVLLFLLDQWPEWHSFDSLVERGGFGEHDPSALRGAIKSLHVDGLIVVSDEEQMVASAMSHHFHWLLAEVPADE